MNVTFGMFLDGYRPARPLSALGAVTVGPQGLLDLLETRLGLAGAWPLQPVRAVQYQHCLQRADDGARFYSQSFRVDALAVAETLLHWRDEWIAAGWDGTASASDGPRLLDLADVEVLARDALGSGLGDRLRAVIEALGRRDPGIEKVRLVDPLDELPPVQRRILDRLPVVTGEVPRFDAVTATEGSDLARLQHALLTNTPVNLQGDGTFFVLVADSEHTLSRGIAGAFTEPGGWPMGETTVVTGQGAAVFDQGLAQVDLPVTGRTVSTPWRPAPQVLRMALSLLWKPLDPHRLLEFLTHPVCPVRQPLRSRLAAVVAEAPGIGGAEWRRVIAEARSEAIARAGGDALAGKAVDEAVAIWLEVSRFDPAAGAPVEVLAEQCGRVSRWAGTRASALEPEDPRRPPLLAAQAAAMSAAAAIDQLGTVGVTTLTRLQLDRLIDHVTGGGSTRPDVAAECGHVHAVSHPGAAVEAVPRVIWWSFSAPALPRRWPWSPKELAQLRDHGAELVSVDALLQFEARAWVRPVMSARRQLVLVMPRRRGKEAVAAHPLWDQIAALVEDDRLPTVDLDRVLESGVQHPWLTTGSSRVAHRSLPVPRRWWTLRRGRRLTPRDEESFSSLSSFINAPHQWVLRYQAGLRPGSLAAVSGGNRQKGALLHRLFEWLFTGKELDWRTTDKARLIRWVDTRFPELLAQEGGNLLLPGRGREAEALRATTIDAAWALLGHLRASGAQAVRMEAPAEGRYCGGRLIGRIDLLVAGEGGREAVLDLKWGGFKYRCDELRENRQLQLAVYAVMRRQETGRWPSQGYFVLEEGRLLAQADDYFTRAELCSPREDDANTTTLWAGFEKTWAWRRAQLDEGIVEVNVEGTEPDERSLSPEGALPVAAANDRFDDYVCLTGWPEGA
jgi:hypothetical protein